MQITWLGHASFRIISKEGFVIYIDPFAGDDSEYEQKANLILISHEGYHHLGYEKIRAIRADETVILSTKQVAYETNGEVLGFGEDRIVGAAKVKGVHAYSLKADVGRDKNTSLGFMISIDGKIIYFAGSTGLIPEISEVFCDIALLPVDPIKTMSPKQAAEAVKIIKPKTAIPMHYGLSGGSIDDAEYFKELVEESTNTKVEVLKPGGSIEI